MTQAPTARIFVKDHSFVGQARRTVRDLGKEAGLSDSALGRLDLVSTELSTNLAKHAEKGGEILVFNASTEKAHILRLVCLDRGPGIARTDHAMQDGVSTTGTWGAGFGALRRNSDAFEITSTPGKGTITICAISEPADALKKAIGPIDIATICTAMPNEQCCGDGVAAFSTDTFTSIAVIDGLGHGDGAAQAAEKAVHIFSESPFDSPKALLDRMHKELNGTRGAAAAIAQIDHQSGQLTFIGVGNITCRIYSRYQSKGCVSAQGIVGGQVGSVKEYNYDFANDAILLIYTDGIKSAASLEPTDAKSSLLQASEIYRDFCRLTDDSTIVVAKANRR